MKQYPSYLKYKKNHKPTSSLLYLNEKKKFFICRGIMALKAAENCKLTYNQIEACRKAIRRMLKKKQGSVILKVFTNISLTKKPLATRMGKGKGGHSHWVSCIKKGQVLCEVLTYRSNIAYKALKEASKKLPIKAIIINNNY